MKRILSLIFVLSILLSLFGVRTIAKLTDPVFPKIAPNDQGYPAQWNLDNWGKEYTSSTRKTKTTKVSNFGIQAEKVWKVASGEGVTIAIVSSGIAYEDYTDPVTGYAYKKCTDFADTLFDTVNARDFTVSPPSNHANDMIGWGTSECSVVASTTNNKILHAGIAYKAKILPIKVFKIENGKTINNIDWVIAGIKWAADCGAKVILYPLQWQMEKPGFHDAIKYAYNKGSVIISTVGYHSEFTRQPPETKYYPGAFPECIAVGGTRFDGKLSRKSNYGNFVTLVAPCGELTEDLNYDGFKDGIPVTTFYPYGLSDTYFFNQKFVVRFLETMDIPAAHVAAVAAMILEKHPTWTPAQVKTALIKTAKDLGEKGFDKYFGYGLLDSYGAVSYTP